MLGIPWHASYGTGGGAPGVAGTDCRLIELSAGLFSKERPIRWRSQNKLVYAKQVAPQHRHSSPWLMPRQPMLSPSWVL